MNFDLLHKGYSTCKNTVHAKKKKSYRKHKIIQHTLFHECLFRTKGNKVMALMIHSQTPN